MTCLKNIFFNLACNQAYHCLQMAEYLSVEKLVSKSASKIFLHWRLPQGVSRYLSALSSSMSRNLTVVIKTDLCTQFPITVGRVAYLPGLKINNLRAVSKSSQSNVEMQFGSKVTVISSITTKFICADWRKGQSIFPTQQIDRKTLRHNS